MEPFKNVFNQALVEKMAAQFALQIQHFAQNEFIQQALNDFDSLELKARSNQIVAIMHQHLPKDFSDAAKVMRATLAPPSLEEKHPQDEQDAGLRGWAVMPMADYVAEYGQGHFELSLELLKDLTMRFSAEFAIRPFLDSQPQKVLNLLRDWCEHENVHVRRLVSEGTRPRLPWGMQLGQFVADPSSILPLLEKLKDDPDEYVRRSVANNLNDIAKDHPDIVAKIAEQWMKGASKNRERLIKHACRTLFKNGHQGVLSSFGFHPPQLGSVQFELEHQQVNYGDAISWKFEIKSEMQETQSLMIDYAIHHLKANGTHTAKVFKWKNIKLASGKCLSIHKHHAIKPITTRVYYPGVHYIEILINGRSMLKREFELVM